MHRCCRLSLLILSCDALILPSRRQILETTVASTPAWPSLGLAASNAADKDPNLTLTLASGQTLAIPRVSYSLYKTPVDQAADDVHLTLDAGVRHFDLGSQYGSNAEGGSSLRFVSDTQGGQRRTVNLASSSAKGRGRPTSPAAGTHGPRSHALAADRPCPSAVHLSSTPGLASQGYHPGRGSR